ncbi:MAG: hypothetical protein IKQ39_06085 [Oscillospiraceae bacterium]|nr:hypothetical protein [Oscillospiraceae bacterium]
MQKFAKEEKTLRQLQDWEKKHLRMHTKVNYNYALTADAALNSNRNDEYRKFFVTKEYEFVSETSRRFPLGRHGETVKEWLHGICQQIEVFRERHAMRGQLDRILRDDPLYDSMEQVFYTLAAQMLHLLNFFQYDRIANDKYRATMQKHIGRLMQRSEQILEYYGAYLTIQGTPAAVTDDAPELDRIQIAVESMQDALEQTRRRSEQS